MRELNYVLALVSKEKEDEATEKKAAKEKKAKEKEQKKLDDAIEYDAETKNLFPSLLQCVQEGHQHIGRLTNFVLKDILKYFLMNQ